MFLNKYYREPTVKKIFPHSRESEIWYDIMSNGMTMELGSKDIALTFNSTFMVEENWEKESQLVRYKNCDD